MNADPDLVLLATSLAFAGAAVVGSTVPIRGQLPGRPRRHQRPAVGPRRAAGRPESRRCGAVADACRRCLHGGKVSAHPATRASRPRLRSNRHGLHPGHRDRTRHPSAARLVAGPHRNPTDETAHSGNLLCVLTPPQTSVAPPGASGHQARRNARRQAERKTKRRHQP